MTSKATVVEKGSEILHFSSASAKIRWEVAKISESRF